VTISDRLREEARTLLELADELDRTEKKAKTDRRKSVVLPEISETRREKAADKLRKMGLVT
jgi:hypothetical protein